jgi:hypothetical protein
MGFAFERANLPGIVGLICGFGIREWTDFSGS